VLVTVEPPRTTKLDAVPSAGAVCGGGLPGRHEATCRCHLDDDRQQRDRVRCHLRLQGRVDLLLAAGLSSNGFGAVRHSQQPYHQQNA
jgi:hypothetical protein